MKQTARVFTHTVYGGILRLRVPGNGLGCLCGSSCLPACACACA